MPKRLSESKNTRCINLDWLEVYCEESPQLSPCDAQFFRDRHYWVREREYGTRVYEQMFTICDNYGYPFIEIRREPMSNKDRNDRAVMSPLACHIKLANRYCYTDQPTRLLADFLNEHCYYLHNITRLDLCLDFEKFDYGDKPQDFVNRYIRHKYTKINQAERRTHGVDRWDGCIDNYISWGSPKSMVSTKIYNKSLELRQSHDKPYIRQAWFESGLIDDPVHNTRIADDGSVYTPDIWRVEFSVHASGSGKWYRIEDCNGNKQHVVSKKHTLETYDNREKLLTAFASLAHHYFHFKKYRAGVRKDLCQDKKLFNFDSEQTAYKLDNRPLASPVKQNSDLEILRRRLTVYRDTHGDPEGRKAVNTLLRLLDQEDSARLCSDIYDVQQLRALQLIIAERLNHLTTETVTETYRRVHQDLDRLQDSLF